MIRIAMIAVAAALCLSSPCQAAFEPAHGLVERDSSRAVGRDAEGMRYPVRIDRHAFRLHRPGQLVALPGNGNGLPLARVERVVHDDFGHWTWIGTVDTALGPQAAVFTFGERAVFGRIPQRRGPPLRIETRRDAAWMYEGEAPPPRGRDDFSEPPAAVADKPKGAARASTTGAATAASTLSLVDLLAVTTPSWVAHFGSIDAARTAIAFQVGRANQSFLASKVNAELRVVAMPHLEQDLSTAWHESIFNMLVHGSGSPAKTAVDAWRDQYGADLVTLFTGHRDSGGYCGWGGVVIDAAWAYSSVGCGDFFTHEIGHNFGAWHNKEEATSTFVQTYARGLRQKVDNTTLFYTVMAYGYPELGEQWLPVFSNPRLFTCLGFPCGNSLADNARAINENAPRVAAYRASVQPALPRLTVSDVTVSEGSGLVYATFTISLSAAIGTDVSFTVRTADTPGTSHPATAGADYGALAPYATKINAGQTFRQITIGVKADAQVEADEQFDLVLSNPVGATIADGYGTATIVDEDGVRLTITDTSVLEGNAGTGNTAVFTIALSKPAPNLVTFNVGTADGTAKGGSDYKVVPRTASWISKGTSGRQIEVEVFGDAIAEPPETFQLTVSNVQGAGVADGVGTATIASDDTPLLRIDDVLVPETDSGTTSAAFKATLSGQAPVPVSFQFALGAGTTEAGTDYPAFAAKSVTIPAGQLSTTVAVPVWGDESVEPNETLTAQLSAVTGAVLSDGEATAFVLNDDGPTLSVADVALEEGDADTRTATFVARLSEPASGPVTFQAATADQTAVAGADYTARPTTAYTIPQGLLAKAIPITVAGDTAAEKNETFVLRLSGATGASLFDPAAIGTIINDDGPTLRIEDKTVPEGNQKNRLELRVSLSEPVSSDVHFTLSTVAGTARSGNDYWHVPAATYVIPANSYHVDVGVDLVGDTVWEPDEVFYLLVSGVTGPVTVRDDRAIVTLADDDASWVTLDSQASVIEGDGAGQFDVVVHVDPAAAAPVRMRLSTTAGSASAGSDFVAQSNVLVEVPAGVTRYPVPIGIVGDSADEDVESFQVQLSAVEGGKLGFATQNVIISDDDGRAVMMTAPATIVEGTGGNTPFPVSFTVDEPYPHDVYWQMHVRGGSFPDYTATPTEDFAVFCCVLVQFAAGEIGTKTYYFQVAGDAVDEDNEGFQVKLGNYYGGPDIVVDEMRAVIIDDD